MRPELKNGHTLELKPQRQESEQRVGVFWHSKHWCKLSGRRRGEKKTRLQRNKRQSKTQTRNEGSLDADAPSTLKKVRGGCRWRCRCRCTRPPGSEWSAHFTGPSEKHIHPPSAIVRTALPTTPRSFFHSKAFHVIAAKPAYSEHELTPDLSLL